MSQNIYFTRHPWGMYIFRLPSAQNHYFVKISSPHIAYWINLACDKFSPIFGRIPQIGRAGKYVLHGNTYHLELRVSHYFADFG